MVLDLRRAGRQLILLALCGAACGGDVRLQLGFELPEGEATLTNADTADLWATRGTSRIAFQTVDYVPGSALALDAIEKDGSALTVVLAINDAEGATIAYGELGPPATSTIADAGDVCCLTMCVCTSAYRAANGCACGSSACSDSCE